MTLDPLTVSLLAAIGALATACAALYKRGETLHETLNTDRRRASDIIFALLQRGKDDRGDSASAPTESDWLDEPTTAVVERKFIEAKRHAVRELNGETAELVKRYLANTATPDRPQRLG